MSLCNLFGLIVLGFLVHLAPPARAQSLTPGLWQTRTEVNVGGLKLPNPESRDCYSKADTADVQGRIRRELGSKGCQVLSWVVRGESVTSSIKCSNSTFRAEGTIDGRFTDKSYDLRGNAKGSIGPLPATAQLNLVGRWISDCP